MRTLLLKEVQAIVPLLHKGIKLIQPELWLAAPIRRTASAVIL